jgi:glycosyltransferase involved in cell wall biosynthesis
MKIAFLGSFPDYQIQLANALAENIEVTSILMASPLPEEFTGHLNKKIISCLPRFKSPLFNPINFLTFAKRLGTISQFKPDVIHLQLGGKVLVLPTFVYCKIIKRYPIVTTFHDIKIHQGEESRSAEFMLYFIRKYSSQIFVHGNKMREQIIKTYHLPGEKVHSIQFAEHGVTTFVQLKNKKMRCNDNLVLFFGRIYQYKGLEYLIKAEPLITKELPNVKIVIAGIGENFKKYEDMMANRRDNFIVHNYYISNHEAAELFQKCALVVVPYIEASQSGVTITAYGFKKPVVVTNVGSLSEIVDDGETGFIVPPRDAKALADAIIKLLKNNDLRKMMGENAYKKLKQELSWDNVVSKTVEVYRNVISPTD